MAASGAHAPRARWIASRRSDKGVRQPDKRVRHSDLGLRRSDEGLRRPDKAFLGRHLSDAFSEDLQAKKSSDKERKYGRRIPERRKYPDPVRRGGFDGQGFSKAFSGGPQGLGQIYKTKVSNNGLGRTNNQGATFTGMSKDINMLAHRKEGDKGGSGPAQLKPNMGRLLARGETHMFQAQPFIGLSRERHQLAQRKGKAKEGSGPAHLKLKSIENFCYEPGDAPTALPQISNQNLSSKELSGTSLSSIPSSSMLGTATGQRAPMSEGAAISYNQILKEELKEEKSFEAIKVVGTAELE
ncbi:hypothetical protein F0562_007245 [Nyssa sinensis]|uniref:Uncharacterized protein n=1 Tax=Nyssa sinensis TaxID=561372 RepID=A0A5J5A5U7_9ASTE|nr:hypothetical protein F0562_007245 [Nyssa sinensis]